MFTITVTVTHTQEPARSCLAKQVLIFWGIKMANFSRKVFKPLGSYKWDFTELYGSPK